MRRDKGSDPARIQPKPLRHTTFDSPFVPMQAPRDVWIGIMRHFRISLSEDKAHDIRAKKRTLLNLALTHSKLADVALDELWKSMASLTPIANVINNDTSVSVTTTSGSATLQWNNDCWELAYLSGSDKERLMLRASSYLARIQSIHLSAFPVQREYMLWHALSTFEPSAPLCPRLRELSIVISVDYASSAYQITPLLTSPSLRSISIHDSLYASVSEVAASIILDMLRFRNVEVSDIIYTGFTSSRIISRIMSFSSLVSVTISSGCNRNEADVTSAHIASFQKMENLTTVDMNLEHYPDDVLQDVRKWLETIGSLSSLTLRGSLSNIRRCIQNRSPMVSICSFGLYIQVQNRPNRDERTSRLIPMLSAILPNLLSLHLEVGHGGSHRHLTQLTLNDILSFRERPMQVLVLRRCLNLTDPSNNLIEIITVWPTLQRLCIDSMGGVGSASEVLPVISRWAQSLQDATLPLQFSPTWVASTTNEIVCPLQHLGFSDVSEIPSDFSDTLALARSLIVLFPRLSVISRLGVGDLGPLQDLQAAIRTLQDVLAFPPRRPDRLFR